MSERVVLAPLFSCIGVSGTPGAIRAPHPLSGMASQNSSRSVDKEKPSTSSSTEESSSGNDDRREMKIAKATKQYVYDDEGTSYLDCFNGVAHVGHCHPQVVAAGCAQMGKVVTTQGFKSDVLYKYVRRLAQTLPDGLDVVYLCNSGSEANDLAIRLARQFTDNEDIMVVEDAFHGNLGTLIDVSPKMHAYVPNFKEKDYVHITPKPSSYRISPQLTDEKLPENLTGEDLDKWIASKCADRVEQTMAEVIGKGRRIAAFLCEPCFIVNGIHFPHQTYFERIFKSVRDNGGLVIVDETQTALGRTGSHFWGFQNYSGVLPDIVAVGRPLGAGHPIGAVITSERVSRKLGAYFSTFGGNPVSCAIGIAVLDVISNENLMSSAKHVGQVLCELLKDLQLKYPDWIGDIRGRGLVWGIEIVADAISKAPNPELTVNLMYGLKAEKILVGITGRDRNVIFVSPPLCFTLENCRRLVSSLEKVLEKYSKISEEEAAITAATTSGGISSVLKACVAAPVLSCNRGRRKRALAEGVCSSSENNAHLFAIEYYDDETETQDPAQNEQWNRDAKQAKLELEEYGGVD